MISLGCDTSARLRYHYGISNSAFRGHKLSRMTFFKKFWEHKLSRVASMVKFREHKLFRVISFLDIEISIFNFNI